MLHERGVGEHVRGGPFGDHPAAIHKHDPVRQALQQHDLREGSVELESFGNTSVGAMVRLARVPRLIGRNVAPPGDEVEQGRIPALRIGFHAQKAGDGIHQSGPGKECRLHLPFETVLHSEA